MRRLKVAIPKVGAVDLRTDSLDLIVWKWQSRGWQLTALVSTIEGGVQEVMRAWKSRWSLEVSHRIRTRSSSPKNPSFEAAVVRFSGGEVLIYRGVLLSVWRQRAWKVRW